jgi:hypothetical protein
MEVSGTSSSSVYSPFLISEHQYPAFVLVYNAGSMTSYREVQNKLEKLMAVMDAGGGESHVPVVVVETQFSGIGLPLKEREVDEGLGREYVEGKGCVFLEMESMTWDEVKRVFGTVVELEHAVCRTRGDELILSEKLDIFHRGTIILREE